jgi:site-specific DNA recombinase
MGRKGPGYISPTVQREAIARWAEYRGVEIAAWHVDEDESGGTQDRPGLRSAIERVESGETEDIACWRLNRFARNVAGAIDDVQRIQALGGHLAFVEEDIDPTGPFGSFILTVLLAVATLERDNMVAGWQTAKRHAIERGAKISPTPYGYERQEDGTLSPPEQAPLEPANCG